MRPRRACFFYLGSWLRRLEAALGRPGSIGSNVRYHGTWRPSYTDLQEDPKWKISD
jgi:hypothetical protein